jgi:hypothetical protein
VDVVRELAVDADWLHSMKHRVAAAFEHEPIGYLQTTAAFVDGPSRAEGSGRSPGFHQLLDPRRRKMLSQDAMVPDHTMASLRAHIA